MVIHDSSFTGSSKEEYIQILSHQDEVWNHIEALNAIEKSGENVEHVNTNIFTQYCIKKGLNHFPCEDKRSIKK